MAYETLTFDVDADGIALLTLNRPNALNSFTVTMARELEEVFTTDAMADEVRAVVVTGAGRAFCAGMDLSADGNVFEITWIQPREEWGAWETEAPIKTGIDLEAELAQRS